MQSWAVFSAADWAWGSQREELGNPGWAVPSLCLGSTLVFMLEVV